MPEPACLLTPDLPQGLPSTFASPADLSGPLCWAILSYRTGDNAQILALASALGWPLEIKQFRYRPLGRTGAFLRQATFSGIDRRRSSPLQPPWPDLVISATLANEAICRWIQKQAGKPVRYVHIGRTWDRLENFDLVVTSPEYRLPDLPNVLHNQLGLTGVTDARLAAAAAAWNGRLDHLSHPRIAVLVGGYGGPYALDAAAAWRLGREASALARAAGGSLLVTTSRRTRPDAAEALARAIDVPVHFHRWKPGGENPYLAFLALADSFVVTCDSAVMLAEACATRRPVYMFDTGPHSRAECPLPEELRSSVPRLPNGSDLDRLKAQIYRQMLRMPPRRMTRDIKLVHDHLLAAGRVAWLGQPFLAQQPLPLDDTDRAVARVRALFAPANDGRARA